MYAGKKLRQLRLQLDVNQEQMADSIGLSRSYYSAVELGKRKITPKMIEKIKNKWKIDEGYFFNKKNEIGENNMRGKNEGVDEGVINQEAEKKGLGGNNKDVFAVYKLVEKLYSKASKKMNNDELRALILEETSAWDDKSLNYSLLFNKDNSAENQKVVEAISLIGDVLADVAKLQKVCKEYFDNVLNTDFEFTDYESYKKNRIKHYQKLVSYKETVTPFAQSLKKFLDEFAKFDKKKVIPLK